MSSNKMIANAVFYSKNSNLILANQVKSIFHKYNVFTSYLNEIDDVILKRYSAIKFLILDLTLTNLDDRSLELLIKLKNEGYILNIIVLSKNKNLPLKENVDMIIFPEEIEEKLEEYISDFKNNKHLISYNPSWVSTIGDFLVGIGLSPKYDGFLILIKAISLYLPTNLQIKNLNSTLYPYLANNFLKSKSNIEMCLRTVIKCAYKTNNIKQNFTSCPTIKEFLNFCITKIYSRIDSNN